MAAVATIMAVAGARLYNTSGRVMDNWLPILLFVLAAVLYFFTYWFFRDPERMLPAEAKNNPSIVISPADGVVTEIVTEQEKKYLQTESIRISIFLSPLDVHVNRIPISGKIEFLNYIPGKYIIANHPKASELNEQSQIGLRTKNGSKVFFKQIVGIVARRLVYDITVGDEVIVGDRFGMMKFGSRMDVALPVGSELKVEIGDKVVAGETVIAFLK